MQIDTCHFELHAHSLEAAEAFYVDTLGLTVLQRLPQAKLLALRAGMVRVSIFYDATLDEIRTAGRAGARISFRTEEPDAVIARLDAAGIATTSVSEAPGFMTIVSVQDPSGNRVEIEQHLRDPLAAIRRWTPASMRAVRYAGDGAVCGTPGRTSRERRRGGAHPATRPVTLAVGVTLGPWLTAPSSPITMTDDPKSGAVLFGKDLSSLARFYEGVAGLSLVLCESDVVILESAQQQLVLHGVPAAVARTIEIATPPRLRKDTAVKLVFAVESIDAARVAAVTLGGRVNDKKHAFEVRGFRACDGHDPEGNIIQLRECLR